MFDCEKFINLMEKQPSLYDMQSKDYSNKSVKAKCWNEVGEAMYENWNNMSTYEKDKAGKELMKKWRTLRDNFVRDLRILKTETGVPANKKKKYVFYEQLSFLIPYLKGCKNKSSNVTPLEKQSDDNVNTEEILGINKSSDVQTQPNPAPSTPSRKQNQWQNNGKKRLGVGKALASSSKRSGERRKLASASKSITDIRQERLQFKKGIMESDKFGNKAFLLSFLPFMDTLAPHKALDVRLQITQIFRNAVNSYIPSPVVQASPYTSDASLSFSSFEGYSTDTNRTISPQVKYEEDPLQDFDSQQVSHK